MQAKGLEPPKKLTDKPKKMKKKPEQKKDTKPSRPAKEKMKVEEITLKQAAEKKPTSFAEKKSAKKEISYQGPKTADSLEEVLSEKIIKKPIKTEQKKKTEATESDSKEIEVPADEEIKL
jgi:hypothetical protein